MRVICTPICRGIFKVALENRNAVPNAVLSVEK